MAGKKSSMSIQVDFSEVIEFIGEGLALEALAKDNSYVNDVMANAFQEANEIFNVEAAAAGAAFKHMFEWGTLGINTGRSNRRPNPRSEAARLWITDMKGRKFDRTIGFTYKVSTAHVPLPTNRDYGIKTKYIAKLNKNHKFRWKAMVLELGTPVTIRPKGNKKLFIPTAQNKRGFVMQRDSVGPFVPATQAGQFSSFFQTFWSGPGADIMNIKVKEAFDEDVVNEMSKAQSDGMQQAGTPTSPKVKQETQKAVTRAKRKANARNGN